MAAPRVTLDSVALPGCRQVGNDDTPSRPFCELAADVAVSRKSQLDECAAFARDAMSNPQLVGVCLSKIVERAAAEDALVEVPDGELLVAVTRALEGTISAEPSVLVEQAVAIRDYIARDGWVIVRARGCSS